MIRDEDLERDMVHFHVADHDERVVRGDWVYYVRAVKRGTPFLSGGPDGPLEAIVAAPILALWRLGQRRVGWKVAVIRWPNPAGWQTKSRIVLKEPLPEAPPEARIAELVADVRRGRFDDIPA